MILLFHWLRLSLHLIGSILKLSSEEEMNLFEIEDKLEESQEIKSAIEKINAAEIEAMQAIIKAKLASNGLDDLLNRFEEQMADVKLQSEKEKLRIRFRYGSGRSLKLDVCGESDRSLSSEILKLEKKGKNKKLTNSFVNGA